MASSDYKKFNREIKGYVELQSKVKDKNICSFVSLLEGDRDILPIPNGNVFNVGNIINASIKKYNWAILRNNYTLLNGDYNLFNTIWKPYGFISNKKVNELSENAQIILDFNDKVDGITLFFQENPLKNANVYLYNESTLTNTLTIENNNDDTIYLDLSEETFTQVIVEVTEWANNELPIWIRSILLGYGYIYENDELIEFTTTEEVNKLVEETPNNELRVTIGDYKKLYDPLNPVGITKLLNKDDTTYTPYVGIITEAGNVQYTSLGIYYFNNIEYNDLEVTITAYNLMEKLNNLQLKNINNSLLGNSLFISVNALDQRLENWISTSYGYDNNITIKNELMLYLKSIKGNFLENLKNMVMLDGILYVDRNNEIVIKNIDKTIKESITKQELLNDIKYINVFNSNSYFFERELYSVGATEENNNEDNFNISFVMNENIEYIVVSSNDPSTLNSISQSDITYTGATNVQILGRTGDTTNPLDYIIFLKVTGNKGSEVTIRGRKSKVYKTQFNGNLKKLKGSNIESNITINNELQFVTAQSNNFLNKLYSYKVSLEYNGNPEIKAGDYIEVESNYGIVPIFIQKHTLKYNGGLSGSIEGVE